MLSALILLAAVEPGLWLDVPFVRQEKNGCGPASAAMVMAYWNGGVAAIPEVAATRKPVSASELAELFRRHGFEAHAFKGEWADVEAHLRKGRPLIVALKEGGSGLHYVVVAGVEPGLALVNDPARRKLLKLDRTAFEAAWKASGNWTLLALPRQPR